MLQINTLTRLDLGIKGENNARDLYIDMNAWYTEFPNGTVSVWHKRNGDQTKYAAGGVSFNRESGILKWTPGTYDTFYDGKGIAEIRLTENGVTKKSKDICTEVAPSMMLGSGDTLEAGWQSLINAIEEMKNVAQTAAGAATGNKEAAARSATAAEEAKMAAEAAAAHYPYVDASGYWMVWNIGTGTYVSTGVKAQGPQGEPGSLQDAYATMIAMSAIDETTVSEAIQGVKGAIAGEYNASGQAIYMKGAIAWHEGVLYRLMSDIAQGAWNPSSWVEIDIVSAVKMLLYDYVSVTRRINGYRLNADINIPATAIPMSAVDETTVSEIIQLIGNTAAVKHLYLDEDGDLCQT